MGYTTRSKPLGGFGQSAPSSTAVVKLQKALKQAAETAGVPGYDPGRVDGNYGRDTHAGVIRICHDVLGWTAGPGCQSMCNTLRTAAEAECARCIAEALPALTIALPDSWPEFSPAEVDAVVASYRAFLAAYIAEYGEGGELDPAQIARREDVSREEAERLAAERQAEADRLAAAAAAAVAAAGAPVVRQAGFSWWWLVLFGAIGSGLWLATRKTEKKPKKLTRGKRDALDFGGLGWELRSKKGWTVQIAAGQEDRAATIFGNDYFPRKLHYKKDALQLQKDLQSNGISSTVSQR